MRIAAGAWRRAAAVLGLLFAALGVMVGYGLEHTTSDASGHQDLPGDAGGQLLARYIGAHQSDFNLSLVFGGLLVLLLVFFVTGVHEHLSTRRRPLRPFGTLMFGAAFLSASLLLVTEVAEYAMVNVTPRDDTESLRVLWQFTSAAEAPVALALGLLILATGIAIWRSKALPRWIAVVSLIGGVLEMTVGSIFGGAGPAGVSLWAILLSGALLAERKRALDGGDVREQIASPAATA